MSNSLKRDKTHQNSEKENFIHQLRNLIFKTTNQQHRQMIENALFLVGDHLDFNHIYIISSTMKEPIVWTNSKVKKESSCFYPSIEESMKILFQEHQFLDEITYLNAEHFLSMGIVPNSLNTISVINLFFIKEYKGIMLIEKDKPNNPHDQYERECLLIFSSMLSQKMIQNQSSETISEWMNKSESTNHFKDQFLSNINHEIQTPLSGIHNAMYLLGTTNLNYEQQEFLQIAQASLERLSTVVEDVLNISKLESGQVEIYKASFDLEEELIRIFRMQKSSAIEKGLELLFSYDNSISFELIGDLKKLRQILMNLMSNAIKYTEKGSVKLSAQMLTRSPLVISLSVTDTGIGINEEESRKIYEQFYQSDASLAKKQQGLGLGLSIVSNFVHLLGGKLVMDSTLNQGSTFTIQLPFEPGEPLTYPLFERLSALFTSEYAEELNSYLMLSSMGINCFTIHQALDTKFDLIVFDGYIHDIDQIEKLKRLYGKDNVLVIHFQSGENQNLDKVDCSFKIPVSRKSIQQSLEKAISNKKVEKEITTEYSSTLDGYALIVDDNRLNRVALESILKKMGMKSKSVNSGALAIQTITNESFDVVLMDLQMPEMDGLEATRRIRHLGKQFLNLPIIAVTANTYIKDYDLMKTAQINDVIFKPIQFDQLNQILRKYIKSENDIHIPDELFIFDSYDFRMRFEGSDDIADEVVKSFLSEYYGDIKKITMAVQSMNPLKIIETTHYFKGSCSYLSGKRIVWLLSYMIEQAKLNNLSQMEHCLDMLNIEIEVLVESIEAYHRKTVA